MHFINLHTPTHIRKLYHTSSLSLSLSHILKNQDGSQQCDPVGEIQRVLDLLALEQALNLWLDSGIGFNSSNDDFFGSGDRENNETNWFFCGEAGKKKNRILEQIVDRVNYGDSYQQGKREREREIWGGGGGDVFLNLSYSTLHSLCTVTPEYIPRRI